MKKNDFITKESLYENIVLNGMSCKDVAKLAGCSQANISKWLKIYGIDKKDKYAGTRFGRLKIIEFAGKDEYNHNMWKCRCDCGAEVIRTYSNISSNGKNAEESSCGCSRFRTSYKHHRFEGVGQLSKNYWNLIETSARNRDYEFSITIEYAWSLFEKQNGLCVYTDLPLNFRSYSKKDDGTASLDRIDNTKGYIEGNVQWVHKHINIMKSKHKEEDFINLCNLVSKKHKRD